MKVCELTEAKQAKKNVTSSQTTKNVKKVQVPIPTIKSYYGQMAVEVVEYLKKHAAPWLAASKNGTMIFYRGASYEDRDDHAMVLRQEIRPNRRPKDTGSARHKGFNRFIDTVGGVANRSNAAFVTASKNQASEYGKVYVYVPEGKFHYTFSPEFKDWTSDLEGHEYDNLKSANKSELQDYIWVDRGLDTAYSKKVEVMIHSQFGLLIREEFYKNFLLPLLLKGNK